MPEIRVVVSDDLDAYMNTVVEKGMFGSKAELIRASLIRYFETLPVRVPSGYDNTTVFSPDGRIFQVEYAFECAHRGSLIIGLRYHDGIMLVKQRHHLGYFPKAETILTSSWEGFKIDQHIGGIPAGISSDYILIQDQAVKEAKTYRENTGEPISVEELVKKLAIFMQSYTMKKDVRPLGCIVFIGGVDQTGCHLFSLDPSGSYNEVLYNIIGYQSAETEEALKVNYNPDMSLHEALSLVIKAILKDETKKPEELAVVVIETDIKEIRKIATQEMTDAWKNAFRKK